MDMRQKLLPIFMAEAEKNLKLLRRYLLQGEVLIGDPDELESAFRAAHTIKGTAQLVEANAVCRIARRLEALLEKNLSAESSPTPVECEAMQLAIDWLYQLLEALKNNQPESKTLVDEALSALDLAEQNPGNIRLVELLDAHAEPRTPGLDDPFAEDPEAVAETDTASADTDLFADDPDFGLELDVVSGTFGSRDTDEDLQKTKTASLQPLEDPFAEDPEFDIPVDSGADIAALPDLFDEDPEALPEPLSEPIAEPVFDPFSTDPGFLDEEDEPSSVADEEQFVEQEQEPLEDIEAETEIADDELATAEDRTDWTVPAAAVEDPFAEDPELLDDLAEELTALAETADDLTEAEPKGPAAMFPVDPQAIADSLLLDKDNDLAHSEYLACVFELCGHVYYLPIEQMREISELPELIPLPLSPPLVRGLINLRGRVMPVIDLSVLNPGTGQTAGVHRLVVGEHGGQQVAFLAEGIPLLCEEVEGEKVDLAEFLEKYRLSGGEE